MADTHMDGKHIEPVHEQRESRHGSYATNDRTAVKRVQNVALTNALELQKPSLFTRRMFAVSLKPIQYTNLRIQIADSLPALCHPVHSNLQCVYQRLRWYASPSHCQLIL